MLPRLLFRRPLAPVAAVAALLAGTLLMAGCDSDDDGVATQTTVQFADADLSVLEEDAPTVEVPVSISNPTGETVRAEVLFASGSSSADFADLNLTDFDEDGIYRGEGDTTGYVTETVTFGPEAEDGDTRTVSFSIADSTFEREETALFALQNVSGAEPGSATTATIGSPREFSLVIEGEGTETFLSEDFSDETLDPLVAISVASSANWGISSAGGADNVPYAIINAFNASDEPSSDWLISPAAYDLSPFDTATLSFLNATNFNDEGLPAGEEALKVKVSSDYDGAGNPEDFEWTDVSNRIDNYSGGGYEFVEAEIDLSDFDDAPVYVAFHYISTGTGAGSTEVWEVDDIELVGTIDVPGE